MDLAGECTLSYYQELTRLSGEHDVWIVQHRESRKLFVKKRVDAGRLSVFRYLKDCPIPGTPRVYEVVEDGETLVILEEYISGDTVQELLEREGTFSEEQAIELVTQLCDIVTRLHQAAPPILHRDIKPSNLILRPDGRLVLIDLGAAKQENRESHAHAADTTLLGTVGYAAPEQYGFEASSVQTDLYAIGVLLNVLLTGHFPLEGLAPGRLNPILRRCTELAPADRYPSAEALKTALNAVRQGTGAAPAPKKPAGWRRWLPPGFRGDNPAVMASAALGYLLLTYGSLSIEVEAGGTVELWLNRLVFLAALVGIVLFSGNYLGVQERLPLTGSARWPVRILGIVLYDFLIFFGLIVLLTVMESIFPLHLAG